MKNLETYLAPEVETVYYLSDMKLCVIDESNGIVLPEDELE